MIIVEGPDGAGKTTLIKQLTEAVGLDIAPRVVSKNAEAMVDLRSWVEENVAIGFQPKIFDRHRLISELIYGPALRGEPEPGFDDLEWLTEQLIRFYQARPIIIYCLPSWPVVWNNINSSEDNRIFHTPTGAAAAKRIYQGYLNRAALDLTRNGNRVITYDYTQPMSGMFDLIVQMIHLGLRVENFNHYIRKSN